MSRLGVGSHAITATYGGDAAFGPSTSAPLTQVVRYAATCAGGPGRQILPPVNADGTSVFRQGRTVPAKFRVCDANGQSVGTAGVVHDFRLTQVISGTASDVNENVPSTTPDTAFRWDATEQQWIFNISTAGQEVQKTYVYTVTLNDGTSFQFRYGLRLALACPRHRAHQSTDGRRSPAAWSARGRPTATTDATMTHHSLTRRMCNS